MPEEARQPTPEQHGFHITIELVQRGSYAQALKRALALGDELWECLDEAEIVVTPTSSPFFVGVPNGVYCDGCRGHLIPGIRWPTEANGDTEHAWVERCDSCQRYASDLTAMRAVCQHLTDGERPFYAGEAKPAGSDSITCFVDELPPGTTAPDYDPFLTDVYVQPTLVFHRESGLIAYWRFADDVEQSFATTPAPIVNMEAIPGQAVFDARGNWIGGDVGHPHLRFAHGAIAVLTAGDAQRLVNAYASADYGKGEAGFASYELANGERIWIVDDAVRTPEGEPPLREPATSPGPLTVMTPSDY